MFELAFAHSPNGSQPVPKWPTYGPRHVALVMNTAWGAKTLRSHPIRFLQSLRPYVSAAYNPDTTATDLQRMGATFERLGRSPKRSESLRDGLTILMIHRLFALPEPEVILCFRPKAIFLVSFAARATPSSQLFSEFTRLGFLFDNYNTLKRALAPVIRILFHQSLKNHIVFLQNPDALKLLVRQRIVPLDRGCGRIGSHVTTNGLCPVRRARLGALKRIAPYGELVRPSIS